MISCSAYPMIQKLNTKYPALFSTQGRVNRSAFFLRVLLISLGGLAVLLIWAWLLLILFSFLGTFGTFWADLGNIILYWRSNAESSLPASPDFPPVLRWLFATLIFLPTATGIIMLAVQLVKRAHDCDQDLSLLIAVIFTVIPIVNILRFIWIGIGAPTTGLNRFGEEP